MNFEKRGKSYNGKPTCATCGKKYFSECLAGIGICFLCGKDGHKVRYCPNIAFRKKGKKVSPSAPREDAPTKRRFCAL